MTSPSEPSPLARIVRKLDAAASGEAGDDAFSTGFPSVDNVLGGGVRRGDLVVLGGQVGAGKSSLALAMAIRMAEAGTAAAFLTHEMAPERVLERALAIEGRCRVDDIRSGALDDMARSRVGAAALRLRERTPRIETLGSGGTESLLAALDRAASVDVAFVDPLQGFARGEQPQEEELAASVRALKRIALDRHVAIVVTAHLRDVIGQRADPRPVLDDFGALGAVKQVADVVLGVFREEMLRPDSGVDGATELVLLKNRNGSSGYVDLYFYKQWLRFEDMLDPDR